MRFVISFMLLAFGAILHPAKAQIPVEIYNHVFAQYQYFLTLDPRDWRVGSIISLPPGNIIAHRGDCFREFDISVLDAPELEVRSSSSALARFVATAQGFLGVNFGLGHNRRVLLRLTDVSVSIATPAAMQGALLAGAARPYCNAMRTHFDASVGGSPLPAATRSGPSVFPVSAVLSARWELIVLDFTGANISANLENLAGLAGSRGQQQSGRARELLSPELVLALNAQGATALVSRSAGVAPVAVMFAYLPSYRLPTNALSLRAIGEAPYRVLPIHDPLSPQPPASSRLILQPSTHLMALGDLMTHGD